MNVTDILLFGGAAGAIYMVAKHKNELSKPTPIESIESIEPKKKAARIILRAYRDYCSRKELKVKKLTAAILKET